MFKQRSPFQVPQVPGSNGRRKMNETEIQKREMSIEPSEQDRRNDISSQKEPTIQGLHKDKMINLNALPTTHDEKFCFQIDNPEQNDQSLYWIYEISNQVSNESSRKIIFREQQYYVRSLGDSDIYQTIYIAIDNVPGFKDKSGVSTNKVCALHLTSIQSLYDDSGDKTYDLLYKQTQDYAWEIPMSLGDLKFRVFCDDELRSGSLSIPLICQFDIRHTGK